MTQTETPDPRRLPRPSSPTASYVKITPFETGRMATAAKTLIENAQGPSVATSWRFFIQHPSTSTNIWFDMGISHDLSIYPPAIQALHAAFKPLPSATTIEQDTRSCGVKPTDVRHIILSHAHWDHHFPPPESFLSSPFSLITGPGTHRATTPSYPASPTSKYSSKIWDPAVRTFEMEELPGLDNPGYWTRLGPFPYAHDFFGDACLWILAMPGHMEGNLAVLARVRVVPSASSMSSASSTLSENGTHGNGAKLDRYKWVLLAGDCAHCNLFTYWPEAPFGKMPFELFQSGTLHEDVGGGEGVFEVDWGGEETGGTGLVGLVFAWGVFRGGVGVGIVGLVVEERGGKGRGG